MNLEEFMKEALKNYPAKIEATVNEQMDVEKEIMNKIFESVFK